MKWNEVIVDVVPLDICGVLFRNTYLRRENKYMFIKYGIHFNICSHKKNKKISLVTTSQLKCLINLGKKFVLMVLWDYDKGGLK